MIAAMDRRTFLGSAIASCLLPSARGQTDYSAHGELVIERAVAGKPHAGKVLAAIQPHADDIPLFAAGTVAKLLEEGYTGHLIRVTNDDSAGAGSVGTVVANNERDNDRVAAALGLKSVFNLNYPNHNMDGTSRPELRGRLIFLFRLLRIDTVISYDPWGRYEENPDHYVTASCVEAACWMAGGDKDYPEHFAAGLKPHGVREKYYYARFDQRVNRVVDIASTVEKKIDANLANITQGPAGENGARLRRALGEKGQRLPQLGSDDATANREYIRQFVLSRDAEIGARYGLKYAEQYHYMGPAKDETGDYIRSHTVPLGRP
jgi:LmbE family N-acetylglucosaminyl deacetylase